MNILVVEDDAELAQLLARALREEAYTVDIARDGVAALELSRANSFDVILLDVMLPGISGLDVARQLRCRQQQVGVLMLTARDAVPDVVHGLDAGADDYLTKPFSFQELLARPVSRQAKHAQGAQHARSRGLGSGNEQLPCLPVCVPEHTISAVPATAW